MAVHDAIQIRDCMARFTTLDQRVTTIEPMVERLDEEIFNHGKDGLKTIVLKHIAHVDTLEAERDKTFKQERDDVKTALEKHNNRVMLWIALLALLVALMQLGIEWSHRSTGHTLFDKPRIIQPTKGEIQNARSQQDAIFQKLQSVR